jgi:hypothetical protein
MTKKACQRRRPCVHGCIIIRHKNVRLLLSLLIPNLQLFLLCQTLNHREWASQISRGRGYLFSTGEEGGEGGTSRCHDKQMKHEEELRTTVVRTTHYDTRNYVPSSSVHLSSTLITPSGDSSDGGGPLCNCSMTSCDACSASHTDDASLSISCRMEREELCYVSAVTSGRMLLPLTTKLLGKKAQSIQ